MVLKYFLHLVIINILDKFCEEDLCHLFYNCDLSLRFWSDVSAFLFLQRNVNYMLSLKYVICTYTHKSKMIEYVVNFYIL